MARTRKWGLGIVVVVFLPSLSLRWKNMLKLIFRVTLCLSSPDFPESKNFRREQVWYFQKIRPLKTKVFSQTLRVRVKRISVHEAPNWDQEVHLKSFVWLTCRYKIQLSLLRFESRSTNCSELGTLEWWILRLMLNPLFS